MEKLRTSVRETLFRKFEKKKSTQNIYTAHVVESRSNVASSYRKALVLYKLFGIFPVKDVFYCSQQKFRLKYVPVSIESLYTAIIATFILYSSLYHFGVIHDHKNSVLNTSKNYEGTDYVVMIVHAVSTCTLGFLMYLFLNFNIKSICKLITQFVWMEKQITIKCKDTKLGKHISAIAFRSTVALYFITLSLIGMFGFMTATKGKLIHSSVCYDFCAICSIFPIFQIIFLSRVLERFYMSINNRMEQLVETYPMILTSKKSNRYISSSFIDSRYSVALRRRDDMDHGLFYAQPNNSLQYVRCLHNETSRLVKATSEAYGCVLLLSYMETVVTLLIISYFQATNVKVPEDYENEWHILGYLFECIVLSKLLTLTIILERVPAKANSPLHLLKSINITELTKEERNEVTLLIHHLSGPPPTITAARFFGINRNLLTSIVGAIMTYLLILLQFKVGDKTKNLFDSNKINFNCTKV